MLFVFSLAYLAAFALYQGNAGRCAVPDAPARLIFALRLAGYALLALLAVMSVITWGGERGIPSALVALCLAAPLSLLLASRWPQAHLVSAPLALLAAVMGLTL